jgi:peptide-methionine (S)-S-oxide reductase
MFSFSKKSQLPTREEALPGRDQPMQVPEHHFVNGHPIKPPFDANLSQAIFGLGCFWGAERAFWQQPGVYSTAVGYAGGFTPNPSYQEVCSGMTGHNEVVLVVFDEAEVSYETLVKLFFESHNPTQGMRQGNDQGTQYRSGIYYLNPQQQATAEQLLQQYQQRLDAAGQGRITTEIVPAGPFYYTEEYHQQYLAKNPNGYCGLGGTGIRF